ncbi:integration host factor subunit beta [Candidatus Poribacteria bacterium]|nr:integration host factor subunit beta [Candidatus Poribacteria bacterium]
MIKADIVRRVTEKLSTSHQQIKDKDALMIVDQIIDSIKDTIIRHGRLEIRDFGVFQIKQRKSRIGRNPKNRKPYPIPPHNVVTFKPGKQIKTISAAPQEDGSEDGADA